MKTKTCVYALLIALSSGISSCVSSNTLYKELTSSRSSLNYLHDSPITDKSSSDTIMVPTPKITDSKFTYAGHLRNIRQTAVPLLIYNSWLTEHEYVVGQNIIKEDVSEFVQNATMHEVLRTGKFYAVPGGTSAISLEIDVDSIHVSGIHTSKGFFLFMLFFYAYQFEEAGKTGEAFSSFSYRLKRGNEIVLTQKVEATSSIDPLVKRFKNKKAFRSAYSKSLVEALSLTFKENIETVIQQVNVVLEETAFKKN